MGGLRKGAPPSAFTMTMSNYVPFNYILPDGRIADRPVQPRESAKLLLCPKSVKAEEMAETTFDALPSILGSEDVLVLNDTKVLKARLLAKVGSVSVELLYLSGTENTLLAMAKPMKRLKLGARLEVGAYSLEVGERESDRTVSLKIVEPENSSVDMLLQDFGIMPIPPYIRKGLADAQDEADYQNVFASVSGSVAASTAGLHFSKLLLNKLREQGVTIEYITLHLGPASFLSVLGSDGEISRPGREYYYYDPNKLRRILEYRQKGKRVIAVGTSMVRALESMACLPNSDAGTWESTDLFIQPGFSFKLVDGLITNFHQPGTTHLLLVQALLGQRMLESAYRYALNNDFRFLSYGDGMFIYGR